MSGDETTAREGGASTARETARKWLVLGGTVVPSIATVLVVGFVIARRPTLPPIDAGWHDTIAGFRHPVLDGLAHFLAVWGEKALGFGLFPALLVVALFWSGRVWAVPGFLAAGVISLVVVQLAKHFIDRARPDDILHLSDAGSFPSGHVANAATLGMFVALVYRRVWVWAITVGYVLIMAFSRTYLHAHWLSDVLGAIILGAAIAYAAYALSTTPAAQAWRDRVRVRLVLG